MRLIDITVIKNEEIVQSVPLDTVSWVTDTYYPGTLRYNDDYVIYYVYMHANFESDIFNQSWTFFCSP